MTSSAPAFELDRVLGTGVSGRVRHGILREPYLAWPAGSEVAVKVLHPELAGDARALAAFRSEAAAGLAARHPSLVRVMYAGAGDDGQSIVMEFAPGVTLSTALADEGPLPEERVRAIGRAIAGALAALHGAGWCHGDVKPDNVRLDPAGRTTLLDLGFVRRADEESAGQPRAGSHLYLAPEQARGQPGTTASDVFALGVLLYELATGCHPFVDGHGKPTSARDRDRFLAHLDAARFVPPSVHVPQLTPFFDHAITCLLARNPAARLSAEGAERVFEGGESGDWWQERVRKLGSTRLVRMLRGMHIIPHAGRARELADLKRAFERSASAGSGGSVVWLEGPQGSGKSRLVEEFAGRMRAHPDPPLILTGRCAEWIEERPGQPILSLLRRWLGLSHEVAPGPRERGLLDRLVPPQTAEALAQALDPTFEGTTEVSVTHALADWLQRVARETPVIVFLDDIGWAGPATLAILSDVASGLAETRLMLILGLRSGTPPREAAALEGLRRRVGDVATSLVLGPFDERDVLAVVESVFHHTVPRLRLARVLLERSRGNPGQLAEIVRDLVNRGVARRAADGLLLLDIAPEDLPFPRSLSRMIAVGYRSLPAPERLWLQRLAIVGGRIERGFLVRAFPPTTDAEVDAMLADFVRKGWLVKAGVRHRFARPALREAVYRRIDVERRERLHTLAAKALQSRHGAARSIGVRFQRAFHLRSAGRHEDLLREVPQLIATLVQRGHPQRVQTLAQWGIEALDHLPPSRQRTRLRIELLEAEADAADRLGYRTAQREALDQLADLAQAQADPSLAGRVYLLHGRFAASTGRYGLARGLLLNAVQNFEQGPDRKLLAESLRRLAHVQGHVGELDIAAKLAERSWQFAVDDFQRALALLAISMNEIRRNRYESALRTLDRAMRLLRREHRVDTRGAAAAMQLQRARVYRILGRPRRALGSIQRAARLAHEAGERRLEAEILARMGRMLLDVGREAEAEMNLREALLTATEIEDRSGQALASVFLGTLLAEAGDPEARGMLRRASDLAREMGMRRLEALSLAIRARVSREEGELTRALALSEQALDILAHSGAEFPDRIVIVGTHVLLLRAAARAREARDLERELTASLRRKNARIVAPILRQRHRRATSRLLEATLSPDGPVFPRVTLPGLS
ncbi:MAG: hypothetical protein E2O39_15950 [Planctomycetota bacterium]|nr:MAG: hypothetical protein E2O39_15950 [Planctomycetota bacterium]